MIVIPITSIAQSSSLLADGIHDYTKRLQLLGEMRQHSSLMAVDGSAHQWLFDSLTKNEEKKSFKLGKSTSLVKWLPVHFTTQFNSKHAYGWNDGAMIPARGIQQLISTGIYVRSGKFSLQLKPEFVAAHNPRFETFPTEHFDYYWSKYYRLLNTIDMPERFGTKAYTQLFPGQSSFLFHTGAFSMGISTENRWWGPGRFNSLVMSNQAPGLPHLILKTQKPIHTKIGSFEGQWMTGMMEESNIAPPDTLKYFNGNRLYLPKTTDATRYLSAITINWQPRWFSGLTLGFATAAYRYKKGAGLLDLQPLHFIRTKAEKNGEKAVLGSLFARYIMPMERAEFYMEFGRADKAPHLINLLSDQGYPRAYVAGFRKLFPLRKHANRYIEIATEFTQMQLPTSELIQQGISWYAHPNIRHGFTHHGQVLGAGIGPGSNNQLLDISWVEGFKKIGIRFERLVHKADFFYDAFPITQDYTRKWIDVSTTFHADWQWKNLLISSKLGIIRSLNYQFFIFPGRGYFKNGYDVMNFHGSVSIGWRL
jgi:hypothetical protein